MTDTSAAHEVFEDILPWASRAGFETRVAESRPTLHRDSETITFLPADGGAVVRFSGGQNPLAIASASPLLLEKYLWGRLGARVRASMQLQPELVMRYTDLAPGWSAADTSEGTALSRGDIPVAILAGGVTQKEIVFASRVLDAPEAVIRGSFVKARGSHLFSPVDYFSRVPPVVNCAHDQHDCEGPLRNPYVDLGLDSTGWGEVRRCMCCGSYWMLVDRTHRRMTPAEVFESLPWERER